MDLREEQNIEYLARCKIDYALLYPTQNGLDNSIIDAVEGFRKFLLRQLVHDYDTQKYGDGGKRRLPVQFILRSGVVELPDASLYRAESRGDPRIWFPRVRNYVSAGEVLVCLWNDDHLCLLNASQEDFGRLPWITRIIPAPNNGIETGQPAQPGRRTEYEDVPVHFKPKDRQEYIVQVAARTSRRRGDRHELLLTEYASHVTPRGHRPSNTSVHPRDLTLRVGKDDWLVEAKVVYEGNATQAVRAAIGQLSEYSHFLYEKQNRPRLMALFNEPVGDGFVGLLEELGIAAVWKTEGRLGWINDCH
ncbi:hypothetical protein QFZ69_003229 [Arthrobacter sp. V1I7]|uniref:hypothetical protein n=1 Tax=Arthrobacter sp. V1I7 TaxID=3042274 RepID=UPI00278412F9|nr:hypothetical protein [Arthrobacter sp. V1I7]MDQ0822350.1 hypothetical protein [Arthrobacter sp. V1I7]